MGLHGRYPRCMKILLATGLIIFIKIAFDKTITLLTTNESDGEIFIDLEKHYRGFEQINYNPIATIHGSTAINVAIGLGITSLKSKWKTSVEINETFPFFHTFLPSFCDTATTSSQFHYTFFLAFDNNDTFFTDPSRRKAFQSIYQYNIDENCLAPVDHRMHFIKCNHSKHPAWAQNDAMMVAYRSGMDYFYRINDDTLLQTKHWTEIYISILSHFDPPNVGVVGPNHTGGNVDILTYDFVHRTHIDIHGFYYPRVFKGWHADRWITDVYKPNRSVKALDVGLVHTKENDRRYHKNKMDLNDVAKVVERSRGFVKK